MIDIDFSEKRFFWGLKILPAQRPVIHAWKLYKDHLNTNTLPGEAWGRRTDQLFLEVPYAMSESLGYNFDKVMLEKDVYRPQAHQNWDIAQRLTQQWVLEILEGRRSIPVRVMEPPAAASAPDAQGTLGAPQVGTPADARSSSSGSERDQRGLPIER